MIIQFQCLFLIQHFQFLPVVFHIVIIQKWKQHLLIQPILLAFVVRNLLVNLALTKYGKDTGLEKNFINQRLMNYLDLSTKFGNALIVEHHLIELSNLEKSKSKMCMLKFSLFLIFRCDFSERERDAAVFDFLALGHCVEVFAIHWTWQMYHVSIPMEQCVDLVACLVLDLNQQCVDLVGIPHH